MPDDRVWTPSDWAWAGGLLNALLPALYFGTPVVFGPFQRFDPEAAFALMAEAGVRNAFLPPTAIKLMEDVERPLERFDLKLRTVAAAGESLGRGAFERAEATFGRPINEFYGQTECNYVLGSCAALGVSRAGAIGKPIPGHTVAVIGEDGREVRRWRARRDRHPASRSLDVPRILAAAGGDPRKIPRRLDADRRPGGARRGRLCPFPRPQRRRDHLVRLPDRPGEVEDCLATHPAVALAAVVGKPDPMRTEIVKAFVVLKPGHRAVRPALAEEIRRFVRERLSAAEYPREIAFVDEIPLTTSGKVIRRGFRDAVRDEAGTAEGRIRPCVRRRSNSWRAGRTASARRRRRMPSLRRSGWMTACAAASAMTLAPSKAGWRPGAGCGKRSFRSIALAR